MADESSIWVGKDEREGIPVPARKDSKPPPHWRLEAVVATERPRSVTISADGRRIVFIQDGETSDVWLLDLEERVPRRLTTGRPPMPYWEDTEPRLSPDGATLAYADGGAIWLVPVEGGPPKRLLEAGSPVWLDDERLVVTVEREDTTRLAVVDVADPWPRRLATQHAGFEEHGDEGQATVSSRGEVAYVFTPRGDLNRSEIRVVDPATGEACALTGTERMHDTEPAWSPDGETVAYASERSGWYELHTVGRDGEGERQLTSDEADFTEPRWHPDGSRIAAVRGRSNRFDLATVDAGDGLVEVVAPGGTWSYPGWTAAGELVAAYEDLTTPPELRLATQTLYAPAPAAVKSAPHVAPEDVSYQSFDGLEIPAFLFRPPSASAESPAPAIVYPHGGPTSAYLDEWDGHAQYLLDKGYAWLAINFRGSTGYGREFERSNHGVWGVDDTKDCLAAADYLRTLDWVDGDRLGIFGASYGSYMALLSVVDDPEHRFRCAVCKYGDCDILTSWAQGDREGVQDLERMMGHPATARDAYHAGSPVHRLENLAAPLLIAHGLLDERVSPKQSEELVAALRRLGKTFEYVTYPTEAHGLLRSGPQLHFYRRLERFLDWYLL
ncbi:MAG: S9 family peptidase [Actinomycetota bacterium]|nr:S9 family peptidase [Actinomycetota bacterium]